MTYFLSFLSILGWVGLLSKKYPKLTPVFPLFVTTTITTVLYGASFIRLLSWMNKLIFSAGLLLLAYCIAYILIKNRLSPKAIFNHLKIIPSEIWIFLLAGVAWYFFTINATLHTADAFYWARYAKFLLLNNGFYGVFGKISTYGINYPPASILFQYFFLQLGGFAERTLYFAQGILVFSALSYVFSFRKENCKRNILLFFILLCFLSFFLFGVFGFLSILVDHVIGIIFGISVLASLFNLRTLRQKILLLPVLCFLATLKENGVFFAYIIVAINIIDLWFFSKKSFRRNLAGIFIVATIIVIPFLALMSWRLNLVRFATTSNFSIKSSTKLIADQPPRDYRSIAKNYLAALVKTPIDSVVEKDSARAQTLGQKNAALKILLKATNFPRLPVVFWIALAIVLSLLIIRSIPQNEKGRFKFILIIFTSGFVFYLALLLAAYLFFYPDAESLALVSMERYFNVYTLGLFVMIFGITILHGNKIFAAKNRKIYTLAAIFLALFFIFQTPPVYTLFVYPKYNINLTNKLRENVRPWQNLLNEYAKEGDTIFAYVKFKDVEAPILAYEIFPKKISSEVIKKVSKEQEEDYWISALDSQAMKDLFKTGRYRLFLLDREDERFWKEYKSMFEDVEKSKGYRLFIISLSKGEDPKLIPYAK